jgi:hypothetical protein
VTPRPAASAAALLVLAALQLAPAAHAEGLSDGARAYFVGPECRVRAEGPLDCDPITRVRGLAGGHSSVQLIVEGGRGPLDLLVFGSMVAEQIYIPVTSRSRGADPSSALPWSAAARPPDATALGRIADPLLPPRRGSIHDALRAPETWSRLLPGERRAWWIDVLHPAGRPERPRTMRPIVEPHGGPELEVVTLDREMPPPVISVFAYVERDEPLLPAGGAVLPDERVEPTGAERIADVLGGHGVFAVDRATSVDELKLQLRHGDCEHCVERGLVVLGAYGTLGEPTDDAVARAVAMAAAVPASVRDVVLYAVDEDCASDLPARWRERLRAEGSEAARRIRVLITCGQDPRGVDADVVMMPAERFRPREAAEARAQGKEVWVYNGRLPQAGPMALDAPPESLIWLGWIAARYDVRRWFLWNVNHWSDGNRGGHGPRDPYADPETFHNADGDAVLYDGLLLLPPRPPRNEVLATARLRRLRRGIQDGSLLAVAASIDPGAARDALELVIPRALGDVDDDEVTPFGDGRAIARARSQLLDVIEQGARPLPSSEEGDIIATRRRAASGLHALRATVAAHGLLAAWRQPPPPLGSGRRRVVAAAVVASCLGGAAIAAWRHVRRRRSRGRGAPRS